MDAELGHSGVGALRETCAVALDRVSDVTALADHDRGLLGRPRRATHVTLPVRMDHGDIEVFPSVRIQYNTARWPTKGGVRYHPDLDADELEALASLLALKFAAAGIPFGGAKGGVRVDPSRLSTGELERLSRAYTEAYHRDIGPNRDVLAPDVNTDERVMAWMRQAYESITGADAPGVVTGTQPGTGGGTASATSVGGAAVLDRYAETADLDERNPSVAIQGFGAVGRPLARRLDERGYDVVALGNSEGAVYDDAGIGVASLLDFYDTDTAIFAAASESITNDELLALDVDVLVLAAAEDQVTTQNMRAVQADVVVEMANGSTAPDADAYLAAQGVPVIPAILANAGGATASYFEWVQHTTAETWDEVRVETELAARMAAAFDVVADRKARSPDVDSWREAAYTHAVDSCRPNRPASR